MPPKIKPIQQPLIQQPQKNNKLSLGKEELESCYSLITFLGNFLRQEKDLLKFSSSHTIFDYKDGIQKNRILKTNNELIKAADNFSNTLNILNQELPIIKKLIKDNVQVDQTKAQQDKTEQMSLDAIDKQTQRILDVNGTPLSKILDSFNSFIKNIVKLNEELKTEVKYFTPFRIELIINQVMDLSFYIEQEYDFVVSKKGSDDLNYKNVYDKMKEFYGIDLRKEDILNKNNEIYTQLHAVHDDLRNKEIQKGIEDQKRIREQEELIKNQPKETKEGKEKKKKKEKEEKTTIPFYKYH